MERTGEKLSLEARIRNNWPDDRPMSGKYPFGEMPISDYLRKQAQLNAFKIAVYYYGKEITFNELDDSADRLATALHKLGYKKGDAILFYMYNMPTYYVAYIAAIRLGMIVFPVDPLFKAHELKYIAEQSGAKIIIASDLLYPIVKEVMEVTNIKDVIITSFHDYLPDNPTLPLSRIMKEERREYSGTVGFLDLIASTQPDASEFPIISLDEEEVVLYTGGTTGFPKGCVHTHRNALISAAHMMYLQYPNVRKFLVYGPLSHVTSLTMALFPVCLSGVPVILLAGYTKELALEAIENYAPEVFLAIPTQYSELMAHPKFGEYDLSSVKVWVAPEWNTWLSSELSLKWKEMVGRPLVKWGFAVGTETFNVGLIGTHVGDIVPILDPHLMGIAPIEEGVQVKVVDFQTREELPVGEKGEILVKSPAMCKTYWRMPEKAKEDFTEDGWLYSGDIGKLDQSGYLYWYGRKKFIIKVSGYTVIPEEIAEIGRKCEDISNIAVIGKKDERKGEKPLAFVQLKSNSKMTKKEVEEWFRQNIASYKVPEVVIVPEIPITRKGSTDITKLKEKYKSYIEQ